MPDSTPTAPTKPQPRLFPAAKAKLDAFLADTVASKAHPAIHLGATTAEGPLYLARGGERVFGEPDKGEVGPETRLQLFSMTKLVTSVAVLQLVERGLVDLDSEAILAKYCPELVALPVLSAVVDGKPVLNARTKPLTVRHLLTHTSGLAYDFTSPLVGEYTKATGKPGHWAATVEGYTVPLVFEPGTHWTYSTGIDWAGILVERVSGLRLSEYFQTHIFGPLGLTETDIGFFPTETVINNLQQACARTESAPGLKHVASPRSFDLDKVQKSQLSGGGGLFGTAGAYLRFLQGVLASQNPGGIISPASFTELFTDSLPTRGGEHTVHKGLGDMMHGREVLDPNHTTNDAQHLGHSVGLCINHEDSVYGRKKGSGCWSGLARTYYWLDPATGIAGIAFTQIISFGNDPFTKVYNQFERLLYNCLEESA